MKIIMGPSFVSLHRLAWALVVILAVALGVANCRHSDATADVAVLSMEAAGWKRAAQKPRIIGLPPGVKPVAVVEGGVTYKPVRSRPAGESTTPPSPSAGVPGRCDLSSLEATLDCRAEVASASGIPVARLWVRGWLRDGDRTRELPWARVGDPITIRLPGGAEQPVVTTEPTVSASLPAPVSRVSWGIRRPSAWRFGPVVGVGLSYDPFDKRFAPAGFVGYGVQF